MKRILAFAPLVVLAVLAVVFAVYSLKRDPHVESMALVGKPTPDLTLPALEGGAPVKLRAAAKGPVLINVFASWCPPCVAEAPDLNRLKAAGVPIVGLAYKDQPENIRAYIARNGNPYAVILQADASAGLDLGVAGPPETYAVNGQGMIVGKHSGILTVADAQDLMRKASR